MPLVCNPMRDSSNEPGSRFSTSWDLMGGFRRIGKHTSLPARFTATFEDDDDHTVELEIAVVEVKLDGTSHAKPVCEKVTVTRNPARPPLTGTELRAVPIPKLLEFACLRVASTPVGASAWSIGGPASEEAAEAASADVRRSHRRRRVTDELLGNVAAVYLEAEGDHAAEEVAKAFFVSLSQAHRYLKQARERGLLPELGQ